MNYKDINLYNFDLPEELIAQEPLEKRDNSNLLVMDYTNGYLFDKKFYDIINLLSKKDVLVLNNTKVIPARIYGIKEDTNAKIEILLLKEIDTNTWECLIKPQKRVKIGTKINFKDKLIGEIIDVLNNGITHITFTYEGIFLERLNEVGIMPTPPYIHKKLKNNDDYQTVYAKHIGSVAAPTAGLHFTKELLDKIQKKGIKILYVNLNVGLGTFRPVEESDITKHDMHSETYTIDKETAQSLNEAKKSKKRIICVGTTVVRTLESNYNKYNKFVPCDNESTKIFIYPRYKFNVVDGLITNFHLPKSSLIMLVSAFVGIKKTMKAYKYAVNHKYRFFSFGDAMFIRKKLTLNSEFYSILENFKENEYYKNNNFTVVKGNNNILLSAPHDKKHIRNNKVKSNEYNTGSIIKLLNFYTNSHIIYTNNDYNDDVSYERENEYKEYVKNYIKQNNIKYFIDIHGIEKDKNYDIEIGTNNYKNINSLDINQIVKIFNKYKIKNIEIDKYYKASCKEKTLSNSLKSKEVETIQLEINKLYRRMKNKPRSFYKLIISLIEVINYLSKEK